ncbi:MAG: alpha/beta hydrolase [Fimbriimonadaceae bacterium]|nr:alpha/beta hydrolase [Alphaproteobacteria bacterium]
MAHLDVNGVRLHYVDEGAGLETIVFSHGLLFNWSMFANQIAELKSRYRCIAYDHRGQGNSEITAAGYDLDTLTDDAAALIEALKVQPCHFVGLSMGGMVAMRLAIGRPELLRSIILIDTSADGESAENASRYKMLNFIARWFGLRMVAGKVMPILFGHSFLKDPLRRKEKKKWRAQILANHRIGITRAIDGIIHRAGILQKLDQIKIPALVIYGEEDIATPPIKSQRIHAAIAGSKLVHIEHAGHSSAIERPRAVTTEISAFLKAL